MTTRMRRGMIDMNENKDIRETRVFGIALTLVLAGLAVVQAVRSRPVPAWWLGGCSALVLVVAISAPRALKPIRRVLTAVARVIGWVHTHVLLTVTFYLIFTPMGLIARLIRKDLLKIRFKSPASSYWIPCEPKEFRKEDYTKQF